MGSRWQNPGSNVGLEFWGLHCCVATSAGGERLALGFQVSGGLQYPGLAQRTAPPPSHPLGGGESGVLAQAGRGSHQLRSRCPLSQWDTGVTGPEAAAGVCVSVCLCVCLKACFLSPPPLSLLPLCAYLSRTWWKFRLLRRV